MVSSGKRFVVVGLLAALCALGGCLEAPGVGRAADPGKAQGPAPWGSATTNQELEKKLQLLNDVLDGKITPENLTRRLEKDWPELDADQRKRGLAGVTQLLDDLNKSGRMGQKIEPGPDREMALGQLYFSERRFIESATIFSKILDAQPTYPNARNLLARCFFFLGNRDRTIEELEFVLANPEHQQDKEEILDALFLMGAAVAETPGMSRDNLTKAKGAWETYLKLAPPDAPMVEHVKKGMPDIEAGLRGEGPLAQPLVPIASDTGGGGDDGDSRGTLGGARPGGPGPMVPDAAAAPAEKRVPKLAADATPLQRALAEGWDALDAKDLATAEQKLKEAIALDARSPEGLTGMGRVYVQTGRVDDALRSFGEAIKANDSYMPAWHYNGMAHMLSGSPAQAVSSWEKIKTKDPAYFARFNLDKRIEIAKRMAQ
ncbi:MAG: tetratricopeptide repeat protein [Deltaproteobacteria bacterium]|nr:tetratricopeptide repeat protein [Deltaproteobacteria bacterium]